MIQADNILKISSIIEYSVSRKSTPFHMLIVGICTIELHLPGIKSLKQKRSIIKSILGKSRIRFNISSSEVGYQDVWQSSEIAFSTVSNSSQHTEKVLTSVLQWIEENYPDEQIVHHSIELI